MMTGPEGLKTLVEECTACPVRAMTIYGTLPNPSLPDLAKVRRGKRTVPARGIIVREGESPDSAATLLAGWAARTRLLPDGRKQILSFVLPGDIPGPRALFSAPMPFTLEAVTDVTLCIFDRVALVNLIIDDQERMTELLQRAIARDNMNADLIVCLGRQTALQRVAHLIIHLEGRLGARGIKTDRPFDFPLRHRHIADALGLTPVHVSRVLTELQRSNIIRLSNRTLEILDRARLESIERQMTAA